MKVKSGPHFVKEKEGFTDVGEGFGVAVGDREKTGTKEVDDEAAPANSLQAKTRTSGESVGGFGEEEVLFANGVTNPMANTIVAGGRFAQG